MATIAGGVAGGIAAVAIAGVAVFFFLRRRRQRSQASSTPLTAEQQMEQVQDPPPPSDDGKFAPPSAPETPLAPMRLYVRVFVPPLRFCVLIMRFLSVRPGPR